MRKNKKIIILCILTCIFVILSACKNSSEDSSSKNPSPSNIPSKNRDESSGNSAETNNIDEESVVNSPETNNTDDGSSENSVTNDESSKTNQSADSDASSSDQNAENDSETTITSSSDLHIKTGASAIEYLKHQLKMEDNEDIVFDDMGGNLEKDKTGSYYTIKLISKSLQQAGGTGTAGIYKVYQDGTYELKD